MRRIFIVIAIVLLGFSYAGSLAWAQTPGTNGASPGGGNSANTPAETETRLLEFDQPVKLTFPQLYNRFVSILVALAASISVLFIIIGGYQLVMSRGNAEAITSGKKTITWAIVGLVVALLAFAVIRVVDQLIF